MPIVKIVQKGWETFNGQLEGIQFKDGVSVEPLNLLAAERIGCSIKIVDIDTEEPLSSANRVLKARDQSVAPGRRTIPIEEYKKMLAGDEPAAPVEKKEPEPEKESEPEKPTYSRDQLEMIADEGGISKLREFAKDYDVKGRSIPEIIDLLMKKQG